MFGCTAPACTDWTTSRLNESMQRDRTKIKRDVCSESRENNNHFSHFCTEAVCCYSFSSMCTEKNVFWRWKQDKTIWEEKDEHCEHWNWRWFPYLIKNTGKLEEKHEKHSCYVKKKVTLVRFTGCYHHIKHLSDHLTSLSYNHIVITAFYWLISALKWLYHLSSIILCLFFFERRVKRQRKTRATQIFHRSFSRLLIWLDKCCVFLMKAGMWAKSLQLFTPGKSPEPHFDAMQDKCCVFLM